MHVSFIVIISYCSNNDNNNKPLNIRQLQGCRNLFTCTISTHSINFELANFQKQIQIKNLKNRFGYITTSNGYKILQIHLFPWTKVDGMYRIYL